MIIEDSKEAKNQSPMSGKKRPVNNSSLNFVLTTMLVGILVGAGSFAVFLGHIQYSMDGEGISEIETIEGNDDKNIEMVSNEILNQKSIINQNTRGDPGKIGDSPLDTLEFDTVDGIDPDIIHIHDRVYAVAYTGKDDDGFLKTMDIKPDGTITNILIDILEFDTIKCITPSLIHISGGDVYAIAYSGDGDDGFIKTIEISTGGMITDTVIDTLEFDTAKAKETDIIQIKSNLNSNLYAIAYGGDGDDGFLKTVEIAINGQITDSIIDTLEFDTQKCLTPNIIHISDNVYGIAYHGDGDDGFLKTVEIATDGQITNIVIDTLEFDIKSGKAPNIIHINEKVYAVAYSGDGDDGFLKTVEIASTGQITNTVIDTLEFDTIKCYTPNIIHISDNVYAIAYHGDGDDGFLKTVEMSPNGQIIDTILDTMEFDVTMGLEPKIIHASGYVYVIAYHGDGDDGFIKTVNIVGNTILDLFDTLEFDTFNCYEPDVIHVSGNVYAIAYRGDGDNGYLKTVEIDVNGQINNTVIDTIEFDTLVCYTPNIIHVSGNVFAIVYHGDVDDGFLKTVGIATNGQITDTVIDILEFDTLKGKTPNIIHISGNVYAIAYWGDGDDGFLKTVEIATNGQITNTIIDTLEFDIAKGKEPNIIHISDNIYAIAYHGDGDNGFLKTVEIATNGQITDLIIDTLEFDTQKCLTPNIIHISDNVYAIAYHGDRDDGFLKTVEIDTNGQITDTVIDTLEFDLSDGNEPNIIHIIRDYYSLVYRGIDDDGYLSILNIDDTGIISDSILESHEFDILNCYSPNMFHISDMIFAIVYTGSGSDGYIKSYEFEIIEDEEDNSNTGTFEFNTVDTNKPNIIHISGNIYAITYYEADNGGFLKTVEIASNGLITKEEIDSLEFDTTQGLTPNIIHISGNVYAIAYTGTDNDGFVKTIEIATDGQITDTVIDTLEFDTILCLNPNIIHISEKNYGIVYRGNNDYGIITLIEISTNGEIKNEILDSIDFVKSYCDYPKIVPVLGDVFAISYTGSDNDGFIKTVVISTEEKDKENWWNDDWSNRIQLIFDNSDQAEDLENFPVLVKLSSSNFNYSAAKSDGTDLRFIDTDNSKQLKYHIENWDTEGNSYVWVKVPKIDASSCTDYIWLYYGNSGATDVQDETETYDIDYVGVWHMSETGTGTRYDSTSKNNDGTPTNYNGDEATTGKIDGADEFDGSDDYLDAGTGVAPENAITISAWIYPQSWSSTSNDQEIIVRTSDSDLGNFAFEFNLDLRDSGAHRDLIFAAGGDWDLLSYSGTGSVIDLNEWNFVSVTYDNVDAIIYVNGVNVASGGSGQDLTTNSETLFIGGRNTSTDCFDGIIDEVRISKTARSSSWIKAQYLSMSDNFMVYNSNSNATILDTLEFDTAQAIRPDIIHVARNVYAIVYEDSSNDGRLKTIEIANNGWITDTVIDALEFETNYCSYPKIIHISGDYYSIVFTGTDNDGFQITIDIAKNGQITDTLINTIEFDTVTCNDPKIVYINDEIYVIVYSGSDSDGYLQTIEIKGDEVEVTIQTPIVGISRNSQDIKLVWNKVTGAHHYNIYRYSPKNDEDQTSGNWDFNFSNPHAVTTSTTWTDTNACNNEHANFAWKYYYIVRAVDSLGHEKKNFNIVGETSQHLLKGRNMIHWRGEDVNVKTALSTISGKYDTVQKWQSTSYDAYWGDFDYPSDFQLLHDVGYLVFIKSSYPDGVIWTSFENWSVDVDEDDYISSALDEPEEFNLTVDGYHVKLQWTNVTGAYSYNIYRTTNGTVFNFSNPIANTKKTYWLDINVNREKHANFSTSNYYIVRAVDSNGKEEQNFNVVGKISVYLKPGRNLFRWMGETTSVKVALKTIEGKYTTIQDWNATEYEAYWADWDWPNDYELEHDMGYLIFVKLTYTDGIVLTYIEQ